MWLLSTDRAELHHFPFPDAVTGGYAILSHTWGGSEQTFQETQALQERCNSTGENPRDLASEKVRECCILAESHGYRWVWNDTCCIDKTSSTELSEAINSMFLWYSCAEVCFAHLEDVGSNCDVDEQDSAFGTARWHSRGWTLQELIAPSLLIFVSQDWKIIGNKLELASLLEQITGVPGQVLTREVHYSTPSVAERMSWASKRNTTRVEDEAYCLMGLFHVNMPTIYGEGRQAFQRLQYEIMKQSLDTSLFAWGPWIYSGSVTPMVPGEIYRFFNTSTQNHVYLLAHSPKCFENSFRGILRYTPSARSPLQPYLDWQWETSLNEPEPELQASVRTRRHFGPFGRTELPRFSITSYGLECRFPIIESEGLVIAMLLCDNGIENIGLLLHPSNNTVQDPSRKKYHAGLGFWIPGCEGPSFARLISLGDDFHNMRLNGKTVTAEWRDIFIADSPPPIEKDVGPSLSSPLHCITPAPPFRLPHWLVGRMGRMGMELGELDMESVPVDGAPLHVCVTFEDVNAREAVELILGTCAQSPGRQSHWAKANPQSSANWGQGTDYSHDCAEHHIESWPGRMKDFGDTERIIRLSFLPCTLTPEHTFVVHLELEGRVYTAMKKSSNTAFPSRAAISLGMKAVEARVTLLPGQRTHPKRPQ